MSQLLIKQEYEKIWGVNNSMVDYSMKNVSGSVMLSNDSIFIFHKPTIEKRFCFNEGYNLQYDPDMGAAASQMAKKARTDTDYFINENLSHFNCLSRIIDEFKSGHEVFASCNYLKPCKFVSLELGFHMRDCDRDKAYLINHNDIANIENALKLEKEKFIKRLNTYLKRYGLTKVRSWTYISD